MRLIALFFAALLAQDPIRTADITARALKPSDFPRITKLAANVYAYEQIDPTKRIVTAGDSLARQAASAEAAARRAAIDSAVRVYRDSAGREGATAADSIARMVPGAPVVPRPAPTPAPRRDTTGGVRP